MSWIYIKKRYNVKMLLINKNKILSSAIFERPLARIPGDPAASGNKNREYFKAEVLTLQHYQITNNNQDNAVSLMPKQIKVNFPILYQME